jgi:endonuclease/exonuclease/phosphatase family metal-dependent hydrolase
MYYAYARHFAFDGGSYGIGILSRHPLSNVKDHRIILTSAGTEDAATRALLTADVVVGDTKVTFATVHMDYRDSNSRYAQSEELVKLFGETEQPVILTGDFNARPGTKEILKLQTVFTDATDDTAITFPAVKPLNKIDYIMVSEDALEEVISQEVYPVLHSDHLPVLSAIKFK